MKVDASASPAVPDHPEWPGGTCVLRAVARHSRSRSGGVGRPLGVEKAHFCDPVILAKDQAWRLADALSGAADTLCALGCLPEAQQALCGLELLEEQLAGPTSLGG